MCKLKEKLIDDASRRQIEQEYSVEGETMNTLDQQPTPILTPPAPTTPKKHSKLVLLLLLVPVVVVVGAICLILVLSYKPKFEVNGVKFKLGTKAGDLMDQGLELCNYTYGYGTYLKSDDEIPGEGAGDTEYYIVIKGTDPGQTNTGMRVTLANDSGKAKRAADCRVSSVIYCPQMQSGDVRVLIDGQDFSSVGFDNQLREKIEKAGMPFKKDEMTDFFEEDGMVMMGSNLFCVVSVFDLSPVIEDGISFAFERRFNIR